MMKQYCTVQMRPFWEQVTWNIKIGAKQLHHTIKFWFEYSITHWLYVAMYYLDSYVVDVLGVELH